MKFILQSLLTWLRQWSWTCFFILVLFLSAGSVGSWAQSLYRRYGSESVTVGTFSLLALLAFIILVHLFYQHKRFSFCSWLGLLFLGGSYAVCLLHLAPYPIEKIHFVEYGLLSYVIYTSFQKGTRNGNSFLKTISLVFFIGFLDEIYQGILPSRRYDNQDVILNFVSGFLGLLLTLILKEEKTTSLYKNFFHFSNLSFFSLWPLSVFLFLFLHSVPPSKEAIVGTWHRRGDCQVEEWLDLKGDGSFSWWDKEGNWAQGAYRITANRLEGLYFRNKGLEARNDSECGWSSGLSMDFKIVVNPSRLTYLENPDNPWKKTTFPTSYNPQEK